MISHEAELEDRVRALAGDVGPLGTIALLGFVEGDPAKVAGAVRRLAGALDLRALKPAEVRPLVAPKLSEGLLVLVTRHDRLLRPILNLVQAAVDREPRVDFGDYDPIERAKKQTVILVVEGVASHAELDPELKRVPYEEYLP